ncbi:30S ribosomal protein S2 [Robiginitomaculum antarcticum]|uniref:30S ribosomal protein S2 n=1 Tax=Robiginitomaculum antarcticum TaxID=437507 RepID=UPI0006844010|nr:30S ribosomal protein S2 [Robiginitomaculum antarcticum]
MALPEFSMRQLLEAGVHFGHQTHRWNPKMAPYIFGDRSNIHILDLSQTVPLLHQALVQARDVAASGGRIMFVGTKRAASDIVADSAKRCAQYYVNHRWLGGMMTNWTTISRSISRLRELETKFEGEVDTGLTKKELLNLTRERDKLDRALGGIKDMGGIPDLMFVIDTNKESIAIKEARTLGIPVIAILDSNCDPDNADFPIPGNDDAARAIGLYCDLMADAILDGMADSAAGRGIDLGASANPVELSAADEAAMAAPAKEEPVKASAKTETPKAEAPKAKKAEKPADDISLIDGVGPTYKSKLEEAGYTTFKSIADLEEATANKLDEDLGLGGKIVSGEWIEQAKELVAGKPPRAKSDAARA